MRAAAIPIREYLVTARSPRMLALLVVFAAVACVCGLLGNWQLGRAHERAEQAAAIRTAEAALAPTRPLQDVLPVATAMTQGMVGEHVVVRGQYVADSQLLVPGRMLGEREGYAVIAALTVLDESDRSQGLVTVLRGWVPTAEAAAPPSSVVQVTGWLQAGEEARTGVDVPAGQVLAISPAQLVNRWGAPMFAGYVLDAGQGRDAEVPDAPSSALADPTPLPLPQPSGGLNLQNLLYAIEWWVFAGCAALLWLRSVRDATRNRLGGSAKA